MNDDSSCALLGAIPFGVRQGIVKDIAEVERGKACGCHCPACSSPLIAKKGDILRHHFAHESGHSCTFALETSVHLAAKQLLLENKKLCVPGSGDIFDLSQAHGHDRFVDWPHGNWLFAGGLVMLTHLELEKTLTLPDQSRIVRPDACSSELLVEFLVSHRVDAEKTKLLAQLGRPAIEVNLGPFIESWLAGDRAADARPATEQLIAYLTISDRHRKWIFDPRVDRWLQEHRIPEYASLNGQQLDLLSAPPPKRPNGYF